MGKLVKKIYAYDGYAHDLFIPSGITAITCYGVGGGGGGGGGAGGSTTAANGTCGGGGGGGAQSCYAIIPVIPNRRYQINIGAGGAGGAGGAVTNPGVKGSDGGITSILEPTISFTATNATNTSPIKITTSTPNTLETGTTVVISGVVGNTAANGTFVITSIDGTHFTLNGSTGNGTYSSGGAISVTSLVSNATNASPIQITTNTPHSLLTGDTVIISSVVGNTAANGTFVVSKVNATNFTLNNSTGNGSYVSGGSVSPGGNYVLIFNGAGGGARGTSFASAAIVWSKQVSSESVSPNPFTSPFGPFALGGSAIFSFSGQNTFPPSFGSGGAGGWGGSGAVPPAQAGQTAYVSNGFISPGAGGNNGSNSTTYLGGGGGGAGGVSNFMYNQAAFSFFSGVGGNGGAGNDSGTGVAGSVATNTSIGIGCGGGGGGGGGNGSGAGGAGGAGIGGGNGFLVVMFWD